MSRQAQAQATAQSFASQQLWDMIRYSQVSQCIHVAAKLCLADALKDGPKKCNDLPRAGLRVGAFAANVAFLCVLAGGCVTPAAVKDASTKHANNLAGIQQAVGEYRRQLDAYYDRLVQRQRDAHIAWHVNEKVKKTAEEQSSLIAKEILNKPDSQKAATDFIQAGAELAGAFQFWGDDFDRWVEKTEGATLDERRQALRNEADKIERQSAAENKLDDATRARIKRIRDEAMRSADELT